MAERLYSYKKELAYYESKAPIPPVLLAKKDAGRYLRAFLGDPELVFMGRRILDFGAGGCLYARYIAEHYKPRQIVPLDLRLYNQEYIKLASGGRLNFVIGNCFRLPFHSAQFDVVFASGVLSQLPDLKDAVGEIARVLTADGLIVGWEPNPFNPVILYRFVAKSHSPNQYLFWPNRVRTVFETAGFALEIRFFYAKVPWTRSRFLGTCVGIVARKKHHEFSKNSCGST